jgi:hypothetical protein
MEGHHAGGDRGSASEIFFQLRFGAIWCDWVLLAARSSRVKVQSSKFKVQSPKFSPELEEAKIAGSGRPPARSNELSFLSRRNNVRFVLAGLSRDKKLG